MKYAIPVTRGILSPHFGHCEQFSLIDVDETKKQILKTELVNAPEHEPGLFPRWLAEKGVSLIFAGGMGSNAQLLFQQNNIRVITGITEKTPENIVLNHMNGTLTTGANVCDH